MENAQQKNSFYEIIVKNIQEKLAFTVNNIHFLKNM